MCWILAPPCSHVSNQLIIIFPSFLHSVQTFLSTLHLQPLHELGNSPLGVTSARAAAQLRNPCSKSTPTPFHVTAAALSGLVVLHREVAEGRSCLGATPRAPAHSQYRLGKIQLCTLMLAEKASRLCILI